MPMAYSRTSRVTSRRTPRSVTHHAALHHTIPCYAGPDHLTLGGASQSFPSTLDGASQSFSSTLDGASQPFPSALGGACRGVLDVIRRR